MKRVDWKDIKSRKIHQDIVVSGSVFFKWIEWISFFLHIFVLILGLVSLIGIITIENKLANQIFETITLVLVLVIVIQHIFIRFYIKHSIKRTIKNMWGKSNNISEINFEKSNSEIKKFFNVDSELILKVNENIDIYWLTKNYLLDLKILVFSGEIISKNKKIEYYYVPSYIVNDVKKKVLEFKSEVHFLKEKWTIVKEINFKIDYKNNIFSWTGNFPDFPVFGNLHFKNKD